MVKRLISVFTGSFIIILIGALFGFIPRSHAQSIQGWSDPINLSLSGAASNPSIVVDSKGVLHVLWVDEFDGYKYVQSMDGITWSAPTNVNFPFSREQALLPVFVPDTQGGIHIFWLGGRNELVYAQATSESLDTPTSWRARTNLDSSVFDFDVDLDAQGRLHIGYVKNPAPVADIAGVFYRQSSNGGNSWSSPSLLYESPYFRSLTSDNARIRIAVSETAGDEKVYAIWDDRAQKRIFIATSLDGGLAWNPSQELISPQPSLGFGTPYHSDIDVLQDTLLVTWQVGEPGVHCTPYSWISSDGGESWSDPLKILEDFAGCPEQSEFIPIDTALYSTILFTLQGDLSISAWDGTQWSNPEVQAGPTSMTNPVTFDPVLLGCKQARAHDNQLFVVGCDQGSGGDIWFLTRQLDLVESLFPLPSAWGRDIAVTTVKDAITSLSSIADSSNDVHALWVQSPISSTDLTNSQIVYSRWNGNEWSNPTSVITDLPGFPLNLTLQIDSQQRLLLAWIDQPSGELLFSWAISNRANIPLEWTTPVILPSSSPLTDSPEMLVDASNRIVIAYAITLNEERGIYIIQSEDLGATWSPAVRVFDAASANWQMVDQPELALTEDGKLHILFTQYSLLGSQQAVGLYYSQSGDGGFTWTPPQLITENSVEWSEIAVFKQTLHRFWRERDQSITSTYHQISLDAGITWSPATALPGIGGMVSEPTIALDGNGKVHLLQILQEDTHFLQEWEWGDERSQLVESRRLGIPEQDSQLLLESSFTSDGFLHVLIQFKNVRFTEEVETNLIHISRSLELGEIQPFLAFIPTPSGISSSVPTPGNQPVSTQASALANINDQRPFMTKNTAGIFLIASVVVLILIFIVPRRSKKVDQVDQSE